MLIDLIILKALSSIYIIPVVPILQWFLRKIDQRWVAIPIAGLALVSVWSGALFGFSLRSGGAFRLERWEVVHLMTISDWEMTLFYALLFSLPNLVLWEIVVRIPCKNYRGEKCRPLPVRRTFGVMLAGFTAILIIMNNYQTLQYAVESNDVALAARRLQFNLAGLGPNDGKVIERSSTEFVRLPLLPVAIENNNKEMVELLIEFGAELNPDMPRNWRLLDEVSPVYVAIAKNSMEMLELLIEKGANPSQGLFSAALFDNSDCFRYLLQHGADIQIGREDFKHADSIAGSKDQGEFAVQPYLDRMLEKVEAETDSRTIQ